MEEEVTIPTLSSIWRHIRRFLGPSPHILIDQEWGEEGKSLPLVSKSGPSEPKRTRVPKTVSVNGRADLHAGEKDMGWSKAIHARIHAKQHVIKRMKQKESITMVSRITDTLVFLALGSGMIRFFNARRSSRLA